MKVRINGQPHEIPSDLSQITLGQFIGYYAQHGKALDEELRELLDREYEDEFDRDLDLSDHMDKEGLSWFSFFSGYDFSRLKREDALPVLRAYRLIKNLLIQSENEEMELPFEVAWNGEQWEVRSYKVTPDSSYTFLELIASKEAVRQIKAIEKSKWDALPYLCAIFFRKKGEGFKESFIGENSERLQLMYGLPMSYAIKVAFFLTVSANTWNATSRSLEEAQALTVT